MATTTKKSSKNKKAKLRLPMVNTSVAEQAQTIAELRQELQDCKRQLTESLEQQTTTSEILRVIASSPTDLQSVWMWLLRMPHGCVRPQMLLSFGLMVTSFNERRHMEQCQRRGAGGDR
jgi:hypothetical protein